MTRAARDDDNDIVDSGDKRGGGGGGARLATTASLPNCLAGADYLDRQFTADASARVLESGAAARASAPVSTGVMPTVFNAATTATLSTALAVVFLYSVLPASWVPVLVVCALVVCGLLGLYEQDALRHETGTRAANGGCVAALTLWTIWLSAGALQHPYVAAVSPPPLGDSTFWHVVHTCASALLALLLLFNSPATRTFAALVLLLLFQNVALLFMHPVSVPARRAELLVAVRTAVFFFVYLCVRQLQLLCRTRRWACALHVRFRPRDDDLAAAAADGAPTHAYATRERMYAYRLTARFATMQALAFSCWALYAGYALLGVLVPVVLLALVAQTLLAAFTHNRDLDAGTHTPGKPLLPTTTTIAAPPPRVRAPLPASTQSDVEMYAITEKRRRQNGDRHRRRNANNHSPPPQERRVARVRNHHHHDDDSARERGADDMFNFVQDDVFARLQQKLGDERDKNDTT